MCVQIDGPVLRKEIQKAGAKVSAAATSSELNKTFLDQKNATKLPGAPESFEEIPQGKIVVADMTNYTNIHIVTGPQDLSHLKTHKADYYLVDAEAIRGLF